MKSLKSLTQKGNQTPSVFIYITNPLPLSHRAHIIKRHPFYVCGICLKEYHSLKEAENCMIHCLVKEIYSLKFIEKVISNHIIYYCPLCFKQYIHEEETLSCLEQCKNIIISSLPLNLLNPFLILLEKEIAQKKPKKISKTLEPSSTPFYERSIQEEKPKMNIDTSILENLLEEEDTSLEEELFDFEKNIEKNMPLFDNIDIENFEDFESESSESIFLNWKDIENQDDMIEDSDSLEDEKSSLILEPPSKAPFPSLTDLPLKENKKEEAQPIFEEKVEVKTKDKEGLKRKIGQKPFIREGARYVCTVCQTKFFTQKEVTECFENHPLET